MSSSAIRENIDSAATTLTNRIKVRWLDGWLGWKEDGYSLLISAITADTEGEGKLAAVTTDL